MNTRGEQLELHEIVKAKIIGAIDGKEDKIIAATIWDACAQMDKYVQMCFSVKEINKIIIRNELFGENWDSFRCEDFSDFRNCFPNKKYADENKFTLREKLKAQDNNVQREIKKEDEENKRFESIISFPNFILQVNEAMNICEKEDDAGLDDNRFIDLLKDNWSSSEKATKFIFSLLKYRYLFDRYIIKREYSGQNKVEGKWSLQKLKVYEDAKNQKKPDYKATFCANDGENEDVDNKQLRLLQSCLRITYTASQTMHWIARVLSAANKGENGKSIINLLERYCCKKIVDSDYLNCTGFGIDRIVFTYLDYVLCRDNPLEFKDFQFQFRSSIEHFFPQHPINGMNSVEENKRDLFGNLALITVSANSRFSNMLPIHKIEQHGDVIAQSPKLMIMSELLQDNNREWDDDLVLKHNKEMLELLKKEINKHIEENSTFDSDCAKANVKDRIASAAKEFIKKKEELGCVHEGVHDEEYYRFTTDAMSEIIPKERKAKSEWGTHDFYFYEFVREDSSVRAQLSIYAPKKISKRLLETYKNYGLFENLENNEDYKFPFKIAPKKVDDCISEENLFKIFEELYTELIKREKVFIAKCRRG